MLLVCQHFNGLGKLNYILLKIYILDVTHLLTNHTWLINIMIKLLTYWIKYLLSGQNAILLVPFIVYYFQV